MLKNAVHFLHLLEIRDFKEILWALENVDFPQAF
tara:strand:+ start:99 stop:200 length:102 start_codon:yes stop_codon:yes gene_type:complete